MPGTVQSMIVVAKLAKSFGGAGRPKVSATFATARFGRETESLGDFRYHRISQLFLERYSSVANNGRAMTRS
jgi:hypothetical protein